jgi:hypothetical protein
MRVVTDRRGLCALLFAVFVNAAIGQQIAAPLPQPGTIGGIVTDVNDDLIPGADVSLESLNAGDRRSTTSGDNGSFAFDGLKAGIPYQVTIRADGFVAWTSDTFIVNPGQFLFLKSSKLKIAPGATSVTVYSSSEPMAIEQVKIEDDNVFLESFLISTSLMIATRRHLRQV